MRKLASVRKISELLPIEGADQIELALVDGWQVVVKKYDFSVGDLAVYFEIDSWIPYHLAPFLCKGKEPRVFNGVEGERLRTVKLRGQISQGLLLQIPHDGSLVEGQDMTEILGIQLYEKPVPAQLAGLTKGYFPSFLIKTDEERVQNLSSELENWKDHKWEVTEKLDGSSMTVYWKDGDFGVCSRNLDLKESENTFWKVAKENCLHQLYSSAELGNIAIQGELIGEGIQGNKYKLKGHQFLVFNIFDIDKQEYLSKIERDRICNGLGLMQAPQLDVTFVPDVSELLEKAEGYSMLCLGTKREGLVFKSQTDTSIHFKAISNSWLLKNE